jgi:hypothetical protein
MEALFKGGKVVARRLEASLERVREEEDFGEFSVVQRCNWSSQRVVPERAHT